MKAKVAHVLKTYGRSALLFHSAVFATTFSGAYAAIRSGVDLRDALNRVPFVDLSKMDPEAGTLALASCARRADDHSGAVPRALLFTPRATSCQVKQHARKAAMYRRKKVSNDIIKHEGLQRLCHNNLNNSTFDIDNDCETNAVALVTLGAKYEVCLSPGSSASSSGSAAPDATSNSKNSGTSHAGRLWLGEFAGSKVIVERVEAEVSGAYVTKNLMHQSQVLASISHETAATLVGVTWLTQTSVDPLTQVKSSSSTAAKPTLLLCISNERFAFASNSSNLSRDLLDSFESGPAPSIKMLHRRFFSSSSAAAARAPVRAGKVSPRREVPAHIARPPYASTGGMSHLKPFIPILDRAQQQKLRTACAVARDILAFSEPLVQVGVTTDEIDRLVHEEILRRNAYPSPLNYGGFPKSLCSSVNEIVVHGIPDSRPLEDGDIVNIDISVFVDGFHGDTSQTFLVGEGVDAVGKRLVQVTNDALAGAIETCCKPRSRFSSIGAFIQELVEREGFQVNRDYTGHGIGQEFHCLPFILHHANGKPGYMLPGMAFTVEPAVCEGSGQIEHWDDGWTVSTVDGKRSAQAEHTVLITEDGVDILT